MSLLVLGRFPVSIRDEDHEYELFDIVLDITHMEDLSTLVQLLLDCRNTFKKGVYIQGALAQFYNTFSYTLFNYVRVRPPSTSVDTIQSDCLSLVVDHVSYSMDRQRYTDLDFAIHMTAHLCSKMNSLYHNEYYS